MRKLCTMFAALTLVLLCVILLPNQAQAASAADLDRFVFELNSDGTSYCVSFAAHDPVVIIPGTYNDLPVTRIGDNALEGNDMLRSVVIPESITSIGDNAFNGCVNLENVFFMGTRDQKSSIGDGNDPLFTAWHYETEETLYCGEECWYCPECDNYYNVLFGKLLYYAVSNGEASVTGVNADYFSLYSEVMIPSTLGGYPVTAIDYVNGSRLTSITIPNSVTTIGNGAFWGCDSLTDVYYIGTEAQKAEITIGEDNYWLLNAAWHFNEHPNIIEIPAVSATCTTAGSTAGSKCADCGETVTAVEVIPALGHTNAAAVEETREGVAYLVVYCSVCGEEIGATVKPVTVVPELVIGENGQVTIESDFNRIIVFYVGDDEQFKGKANPNWTKLVTAGKQFAAENGINGYKVYKAGAQLPALTLSGNYAISVKYNNAEGVEKTKWFTPFVEGEEYYAPKLTVGEDNKLSLDIFSTDTFVRIGVFYLGDNTSFAGKTNPNFTALVRAGKQHAQVNGSNGYLTYAAGAEMPMLTMAGNYAIYVKYNNADGVQKTIWFTPEVKGEAYHAPVITVDENGQIGVDVHDEDTFLRVCLFYIGDYEPQKNPGLYSGWLELIKKGKEFKAINGSEGYKIHKDLNNLPQLDDPSNYAILVKYNGADGTLRTAYLIP